MGCAVSERTGEDAEWLGWRQTHFHHRIYSNRKNCVHSLANDDQSPCIKEWWELMHAKRQWNGARPRCRRHSTTGGGAIGLGEGRCGQSSTHGGELGAVSGCLP